MQASFDGNDYCAYCVGPTAVFSAHFGMGEDKILLDDVKCLGNESALTECVAIGYTAHNCQHREDAGVLCQGILGYMITK